jgi:hypothetical protein
MRAAVMVRVMRRRAATRRWRRVNGRPGMGVFRVEVGGVGVEVDAGGVRDAVAVAVVEVSESVAVVADRVVSVVGAWADVVSVVVALADVVSVDGVWADRDWQRVRRVKRVIPHPISSICIQCLCRFTVAY